MKIATPQRLRAVGFLLLEAAGVVLLIVQQRHDQKVRRQAAILSFAGRVFDFAKKAAKA